MNILKTEIIFETLEECIALIDDLNLKDYVYWNNTSLMTVKKDITSIFGHPNMIFGADINHKEQTFYLFTKSKNKNNEISES